MKSQDNSRHCYVFASGPADPEKTVALVGVFVPLIARVAMAGGAQTRKIERQAADCTVSEEETEEIKN